ncbi:protein kinase domain-containing protein [Actinomadura rifamycini]|uniref:serine/threonine-protein kinase n=1 Tax=Actinomadura rifamycini TaxID=31962 RepID=UPI000403861A|nr:serine/threonine-protein kinase [Actinomadura rifamycini]
MGARAPLEADDPERVGRYRLVGRLGQGGMGRVYLGLSPGGRAVAVKVVRDELAEDPGFRGRFVREVRAARRVTGLFTAAVVDADPDGDPPWLATEYVPGMSLREAVAAHGPWPERSVRALGAALAEALEAVHAAGVVHRDLKPSNILLAEDGPRLIDFGISLAVEGTRLTVTGAALGTPGFMAPEQLRGGDTGPAGDVFALGAVLAHAATGDGPFGGGSAHALNYRVVHEPPNLAALPSDLAHLVARCLAKDPGARPAVSELVAELAADGPSGGSLAEEGWLPGPVTAELTREYARPSVEPAPTVVETAVLPDPPPAGRRRWARRPLLAGAAVAAVIAVVAAVVLVSGGSGAGSSGASEPSASPDPPKLTQLWSYEKAPSDPPVVADGTVYFDRDSVVYAVDARTGGLRWTFDRTGIPLGLTVVGGRLYFESGHNDDGGRVYALDAGTGRQVWEHPVGSTVTEGPIVADGAVYFGTSEFGEGGKGGVHAVDAATGRKMWSAPAGLVGGLAVADGVAYFAEVGKKGREHRIHAVDARTGEERLNLLDGNVRNRLASLTAADGVLYALSDYGGVLTARDSGGRVRWRIETEIEEFENVEFPTVRGGVLYLGGNDYNEHNGTVLAVDARTGKELWREETADALTAPPRLADGIVYVSTKEGDLHLLDARAGDSRGTVRLADGSDASPAVVGGTVYFDGGDGRLRAAEMAR